MLTRCPTCQTTFHVTSEQLKARQGRVRCGRCQGVFNALEALVDETTTLTPPLGARPPSAKPEVQRPAVAEPQPAPATAPAAETLPAESTATEPLAAEAPTEESVAAAVPAPDETEVAPLGDEIAEALDTTTIDIVALDDADFDDEDVFAVDAPVEAEKPAPDFTKTVITDFSRFVSTELPAVHEGDDEIATVVADWHKTPTAEEAPVVEETPADDNFARTVVDYSRFPQPASNQPPQAVEDDMTEPVVAGDATEVGGDFDEATVEISDFPAAGFGVEPATADEFAQTVVLPRAAVLDAGRQPQATTEAATAETAVAATEPATPEGPAATAEAPEEPPGDRFAATPVAAPETAAPDQPSMEEIEISGFPTIDIALDLEPPAAGGAETGAEAEVQTVPIGQAAAEVAAPAAEAPSEEPPPENEFAKTVVIGMKGADIGLPGLSIADVPADLGGTAMDFDTVGSEADIAETSAPESTGEEISTLKLPPEAMREPSPEELDDEEYAKTVVESIRAGGGIAHVDFELEPIDDIQVEESEEEEESLLASIKEPRTVFPVLEAGGGDETSQVPSDTILRQATANAGAQGAAEAATEAEAASEIETITVPPLTTLPPEEFDRQEIAEPTAPGATEPDIAAEIEMAATPEPVPELQELPTSRRWPWLAGTVIAGLALLAQMVVHFRVEAAVLMPAAKPALMAMCDVLDCKVPLPSRIELVGIETSDLTPAPPEGAGNLQLAATLRNRAPYKQTWPYLELTLTDAADKALVRRALAPNEYLPAEFKIDDGFPARGEQPVHLVLRAPGVPAVGYRLYVFYP